jgi:hypothetical protein
MHQRKPKGFGNARYVTCPCSHVVGPLVVGTQSRSLMPDVYTKMKLGAKRHLACSLNSWSNIVCMRCSTWPDVCNIGKVQHECSEHIHDQAAAAEGTCLPQRKKVSYTLDQPAAVSGSLSADLL